MAVVWEHVTPETGLVDVVLRPEVYARHTRLLDHATALMVTGVVQHRQGAVSMLGD